MQWSRRHGDKQFWEARCDAPPDRVPSTLLRAGSDPGPTHSIALKSFSVRFLRTSAFSVLFLAAICTAQTNKAKELPASAYQLISVIVTGGDRYKPEDLMAATGMKIGETVRDEDFKDAARVLADSGAFSDVAYSFEYSPEGTKLQWQVKDATDFVPVDFENFVWFSDQALVDAVHATVPLFHGQLPARGRMADQVSEALQVLLSRKAIPGSVDYLRVGPEDGPPQAFAFSVTGPNIVIRKVEFSGAAPDDLPLLQRAAESLQGAQYVRSTLRMRVNKVLLPIYLERGYLKASFSEPRANVVSSDAGDISLDASFVVEPGQQYKLAGVDFSGNKAVSAETLRSLIHATLNQPANSVQLDNDIATMKQLYGRHGYVAASIKSKPEIDEANSTVRYVLNIIEGAVYKMGELEILGLDDHATSRLQNEWTLRAGDTYDSSYAQRFLNQAYKEIGDWRVRVDETQNRDDTVDVTLRFDSRR